MATKIDIDKSLLIEGLGKGLRVIESFSDSQPRLTASEAARLAGLTRTAARRYLLSLVHYGYADTDGKHYWLLPAILRLGRSYLEAARLPRLVQPFMQRLSMQIGETANLSVLDGHEIVYLTRSNSPRIVSIGFHPGARVPAHVVSPGFAILSTFSERQLDEWFEGAQFGQFTAETITDPARPLRRGPEHHVPGAGLPGRSRPRPAAAGAAGSGAAATGGDLRCGSCQPPQRTNRPDAKKSPADDCVKAVVTQRMPWPAVQSADAFAPARA